MRKQRSCLMKVGLFCLLVLLVGHSLAQCDTCRVTGKIWNGWGTQTICGIPWTAEGDGGYFGAGTNGKGQQFGSASNSCSYLTLTGTPTDCDIEQVTVFTSGASGVVAIVGVSVGGVPFTCHGDQYALIGAANAPYIFTGVGHGEIEINWTQTTSKALYFAGYAVCCSSIPMQEESLIVCDSTTWRGMQLFESGTYRDTVYAGSNIDMIHVLNLQVFPSPDLSFEEPLQICAGHEIEINSITDCAGGQIFYEDFSAFDDDCGDQAARMTDGGPCENPWTLGGSNVNDNLPTFVECGRVYKAGGKIKMGRTSNQPHEGFIKTVAGLDLSTPFTVTLRAKGWGVADTSADLPKQSLLKVEIGGVSQMLPVDGYKPWPGTYNDYVYHFAGTTADQILISTVEEEGYDPRVFLDFVLVTKDDACEYLWDNDETTPSITVAPNENTMYHLTVTDLHGCSRTDSVMVNVTTNMGHKYVEACSSYNWYEHTNITESCDNLTHTFENGSVDGCDSVVTLHLTIHSSDTTRLFVEACGSYDWNGQHYTQSTIDVMEYASIHDCDSIVILNLTINQPAQTTETATSCVSYEWNGQTYTASGEYIWTGQTTTGCDSIVTLNLTINQPAQTTETATSCGSYEWNGQTYTASGEYIWTGQTTTGCDSIVTLNLTINQPAHTTEAATACESYDWNGETYTASGEYIWTGRTTTGCDSIVTLNLTINQPEHTSETATACESYDWNGETYTASGEYIWTGRTTTGCDSIVTLQLTINQPAQTTETASACESYEWNGQTYTASGEYTWTGRTTTGCDSIVTLNLTINQPAQTTETATSCGSYEWNGQTYTASGEYTWTGRTTTGCDSIVTLNLTINQPAQTTETATACESYDWNGETYTASGEYIWTGRTTTGSDSIVTLNLTINQPEHTAEAATACESYDWNGNTYTASGTYTWTGRTTTGCDSIVTLNLTINEPAQTTETATSCGSYEWNGQTYTASGEYIWTGRTTTGCDSIVTLNLTINHPAQTTETATACESYDWNGETYTASGEYTWTGRTTTGCDSIVTLQLTINQPEHTTETATACESYDWNGETYTASGTYTWTGRTTTGCDSIVTLQLTINQPEHTTETATACESYEWNGQTYTASGTYTWTGRTTTGCDSIVTLNLTINQTEHTAEAATACESYDWNGTTYTASGEYTWTGRTTTGCDSIVTLNLTINQPEHTAETATACESYDWNGETYTASGTYTWTGRTTTGCDSTVTLNLTINQPAQTTETATSCESYEWNGQTYTASGTYTWTGRTTTGCDSIVTLQLTINQPEHTAETATACESYDWNGNTYTASGEYTWTGRTTTGCDSIVTLQLTINQPAQTTETATSCGSYEWNDQTYTASGEYIWTGRTTTGCDSIVTLNLTINQPTEETITATVIENDLPYILNGAQYDVAGTYAQHLTSAAGCDSTLMLILTVVENSTTLVNDTICYEEIPYTWNGVEFNEAGVRQVTLTSTNGADSVVVMTLEVNVPAHQSVTQESCDIYTWKGQTYTESGTYTFEHVDVNGCTQVDTLHLTINQPTTYTDVQTACVSYTWQDGVTYTESTSTPTLTLTNAAGCDSVVTLNLTINQPTEETITATVLENDLPYILNGAQYDVAGTYAQHLTSAAGCDSTLTLILTVVENSTTLVNDTICYEEIPYTWNGVEFNEAGVRQVTLTSTNGADSVVVMTLEVNMPAHQSVTQESCDIYTWNGQTYTESGTYTFEHADANGCTQVDTLHLTINQPTTSTDVQTACGSYTWQDGVTYTESTSTPTLTLTNAAGCDSIVTLHLTINQPSTYTDVHTACNSYTWIDGVTYTESTNTPMVSLTNAAGCDSIVTLNLTINQSTLFTDIQTACGSYTWIDEVTYTESTNIPTVTLTNADGCDSVVALNLTINQPTTSTDIQTACGSYTWIDGNTYTESTNTPMVTLTNAAGCDSIVTLHLTINQPTTYTDVQTACGSYTWHDGVTYTESTNTPTVTLTNAAGCDSIVTLHLTINQPTTSTDVQTACVSYTWQDGVTYTESTNTPTVTLTNAAGCDSIVTLNLTINQPTEETITATVLENDLPYILNGAQYGVAGTYAQHLTNAAGCDSTLTLILTVVENSTTLVNDTICYEEIPYTWNGVEFNEAGVRQVTLTSTNGADSVVVMTLVVNQPTMQTLQVAVVENSLPYVLNEIEYEEAGTYTQHLTNVGGCDSTLTLILTVNENSFTEVYDTICDRDFPYIWNGVDFRSSGEGEATLTASNGTDSVVVMHLTVFFADTVELDVNACGDYVWNGQTITENGTYTQMFTNMHGCDSLVTIHLTINAPTTYTDVQTACDSFTWIDDITYTESTNVPTVSLINAAGCDSIVTLNLTINQSTLFTDIQTACGSYTWQDGVTYTESTNTPTVTLTNADGCDSVVTLNLTINQPTTSTDVQTACGNYTWQDGVTYTESTNTPTVTLTNAAGCDSIVTLNLTINQPTEETIIATVLENDLPYILNGAQYDVAGTYAQHLTSAAGCDSTLTLILTVVENSTTLVNDTICYEEIPYTWNGVEFNEAGVHQVTLTSTNGADSVVVMTLVVNQPTMQTLQVTVVENSLPYVLNEIEYEEAGTYTQHLTNVGGCDSTLTLILTVNENSFTEVYDTICDRDFPYIWNGVDFRSSGEGEATLTASNGTDSVVVMHLTVFFADTVELDVNACGDYVWNGQTIAENGTYTQMFTNMHGCDSLVTIHLTINAPTTYTDVQTACDSLTWIDGITYTTSTNAPTMTLTNTAGCDSVVTLNLTIHQSAAVTVDQTVVENEMPFVLNGVSYDEAGTYIQRLTTMTGCDSILTLNLTVLENTNIQVFDTICDNELPFEWNGVEFHGPGIEQVTFLASDGTDSVVTMRLAVYPVLTSEFTEVTCRSFSWHGQNYTETGDYEYTFTSEHGCDSIVTLHLTILPPETSEFFVSACENYTWNGETYIESGDYRQRFTTALGCDSTVTMHLEIFFPDTVEIAMDVCDGYTWNGQTYTTTGDYTQSFTNVHGCDSMVLLHLTIHTPDTVELSESACESFTWNGQVYTQNGDYTQNITNSIGCDSVVTIHLTIFSADTSAFMVSTCGEYAWNGQTYTATGDYTQTLTNANGCDSVVTLHLTILPADHAEFTDHACNSYTWNGQIYSASGDYTQTFTNTIGCDSVVTLHLTINEPSTFTDNHTACGSYTWIDGITYTASTTTPTVTLTNAAGCDSIVTLHLTIYPNPTNEITASACVSYMWNAQTYTQSGNYTQTFTSAHGCDSVVTLHLTIYPTVTNEITESACVIYTWNAQTYTQSGNYTQTFANAHGCDSVVTLHLTIYPTVANEITESACNSYTWNNLTYNQSGDYTQTLANVHGCDSVVTLHLTIFNSDTSEFEDAVCDSYTWNGQTYSESGDYEQTLTNVHGCDSVVTLHLTIYPVNQVEFSAEACNSYTWNDQTYTNTGNYTQIFANVNGCDSVVTLHLIVIDTTVNIVSLVEDFCEYMSTELMAETEMTNYQWSTGDITPTITVESPGLYSLTATEGNCSGTATIEIEPCELQLYLPNAITPGNHDGLNDVFMIPERSQRMLESANIYVYNRWGELVYHSADKNFQWDGSYRGEIFKNVIYNYIIYCTDLQGRQYMFKGSLTVL